MFGLACVHLLRAAVLANAEVLANTNIAVPIPFIYNIPMKPLSNFESIVFNISDCNEFYSFDFEESATDEDRIYFGENNGTPMIFPESSGMLTQGVNILTTPCKEVNRTVPYFVKHNDPKESMNEFVWRNMMILNEGNISLIDKHLSVPGLEVIPDGMLTIGKASKSMFNYTLQVND